jgi:hypothetical protein
VCAAVTVSAYCMISRSVGAKLPHRVAMVGKDIPILSCDGLRRQLCRGNTFGGASVILKDLNDESNMFETCVSSDK